MLLHAEASRESKPAIARVERVCAGYDGRLVLRDLSIDLRSSEIFVVLGPNGAGKSTLVRLLTGALKPSSGAVEIEGGPRAVGLAPQETALYPWLTARENVFAFARFEGLRPSKARERAAWALALAEADKEADTPVGRLSGGYRKRVNIAAALVKKPALLILDEPMAGVDLDARRAIASAILGVKASGTSVLLITHDFEEADSLADRAGIIIQGRLAEQGTPAELVERVLGSAKRIDVVLAQPPNEAERGVLAREGAAAVGEAWVLYRRLEDWNVAPVIARLAEHGLKVKETRLREPGLESVYSTVRAIS